MQVASEIRRCPEVMRDDEELARAANAIGYRLSDRLPLHNISPMYALTP